MMIRLLSSAVCHLSSDTDDFNGLNGFNDLRFTVHRLPFTI